MKKRNKTKVCGFSKCNRRFYPKRAYHQKYCSIKCTRNAVIERRYGRIIKGEPNRLLVLSYFNYECQVCGIEENPSKLVIHHIVPLSLGGRHHFSNITILCKKCHKNIHHGIFDKKLNKMISKEALGLT